MHHRPLKYYNLDQVQSQISTNMTLNDVNIILYIHFNSLFSHVQARAIFLSTFTLQKLPRYFGS